MTEISCENFIQFFNLFPSFIIVNKDFIEQPFERNRGSDEESFLDSYVFIQKNEKAGFILTVILFGLVFL